MVVKAVSRQKVAHASLHISNAASNDADILSSDARHLLDVLVIDLNELKCSGAHTQGTCAPVGR